MAIHYDLDIWKASRKMALYLHKQVKPFNNVSDDNLANEITDCAITVPSIIADAFTQENEEGKIELITEANELLSELEIMLQKAGVRFNLEPKALDDGLGLINECKMGLQFAQEFKLQSPLKLIGNRVFVTPPNNPQQPLL